MNVINTLDRGLMERTIKAIKKRKDKKELDQNPVLMTDFYR